MKLRITLSLFTHFCLISRKTWQRWIRPGIVHGFLGCMLSMKMAAAMLADHVQEAKPLARDTGRGHRRNRHALTDRSFMG